jgi:1,6-anhydro-N-acetylmuramate kinase
MERTRLVLGAMTGTSIDGIDLAVVRIAGTGLGMRAACLATRSAPLGPLADGLRAAADQQPMAAGDFAALARDLGMLHAREAMELLRAAGIARVDLAALHGQTVFHRPPVSWQLLNPHPVARALGCETVHDLRGADLALGGEGAPLTPLADWILFRARQPRAVVNLGGFANATLLPPDDGIDHARQVAAIRGADLCACNQLLDRAARTVLGTPFDKDGATAAAGMANDAAGAELRALLAPRADGRSLGTGDELFSWVDRHAPRLAAADLLATAAHAVGTTIGTALHRHGVRETLVAGGGALHGPLRAAIAAAAHCPVSPTDNAGIPVAGREAVEWAILGALAQDGVDIALPAVTRRPPGPSAVHGAWTRGLGPAQRAAREPQEAQGD